MNQNLITNIKITLSRQAVKFISWPVLPGDIKRTDLGYSICNACVNEYQCV